MKISDCSKEEWWLDFSFYPIVLWAKLRVAEDGSASVLDCDGQKHQFNDEGSARWFLLEDEYLPYDKIDAGDEVEHGFEKSFLKLPLGEDRESLIQKYE